MDMSDKFNERVSQFIDDEMSSEESELFVRYLERDEHARRQYLRYQLIGTAARGEHLHSSVDDFRNRLNAAIDAEPRRASGIVRHRKLLGGTAVAAGIALIAVVAMQISDMASESTQPVSVAESEAATVVDDGPDVEPEPLVRAPDRETGIQYLIHHAAFTTGMTRTSLRSSVLSAQHLDYADSFEDAGNE